MEIYQNNLYVHTECNAIGAAVKDHMYIYLQDSVINSACMDFNVTQRFLTVFHALLQHSKMHNNILI